MWLILPNSACTIVVVMTTLVFIIVSCSHEVLLVASVHTLVAFEVILCFQGTLAVQSNDIAHPP